MTTKKLVNISTNFREITEGESHISNVAKRLGYHQHWEPIFIGTNRDPLYDERLSWEGRADKMSHVSNLVSAVVRFCLRCPLSRVRFWLHCQMSRVSTYALSTVASALLFTIFSFLCFQAFQLCVMDYDLLVLDNAFLIHKPGIKTKANNPTKPAQEMVNKQNTFIRLVIKPEIIKNVGNREGCD